MVKEGQRLLEGVNVEVTKIEQLLTPTPTTSDKDSADLAVKIRYLIEKTEAMLTQVTRPTTPTIYNKTCTSANTEYSQTLPEKTKKFTLKARGGTVKVCFTSGQSGTTYIELTDGQSWSEDNIEFTGTVYYQSPTAGTILEIVAWT
jgi:hypothetical protein